MKRYRVMNIDLDTRARIEVESAFVLLDRCLEEYTRGRSTEPVASNDGTDDDPE